MKRLVQIIVMVFGGILVLSSGQMSHVSAMHEQPVSTNDSTMTAMSSDEHCLTTCTSITNKKENLLEDVQNDDEDTKPQPPYYLQFNSINNPRSFRELERNVVPDPDMKIPLYKLCGVVRR